MQLTHPVSDTTKSPRRLARAVWRRPQLMIDDTASSTHAFSAFTEDGGLQVS
ncbi:hypothetical protein [Tistrella mobilis]|jgi:hypothetical protein|uniref:Uncharacterized protein n=1 Tax=Tistrella mobilis (strain KA081020-065) TaxID=1110502 RepID=I3TUR9_TISMK|nr:hypothetical protein [Tistrella mobilis]AFK56507.1 hypothetical protein TMO_b0499 [Tistrella mobilis KA081020-065]